MKKKLSALLAVIMTASLLFTSCSDNSGKADPRPYPDDYNPTNDTLLIGCTEFNGLFSPLYYNTAYDGQIVNLLNAGIYHSGPGGQLVDGLCTYKAPEIIKNDEGEAIGAIYTFTLKEGVTFSDGTPVTADDIIFSYKLNVDPMYEGLSALYTYPIPGIKEYRYDDPDYAEKVAAIEAEAANISDDEIMVEVHAMSVADYEDANYGPDGLITDLGLVIDETLEAGSDAYKEAVIAAADEAYFAIYKDYFAEAAASAKLSALMSEYVQGNLAGGAKVTDIEGIKKIDERTVQVTLNEIDPTAEVQLAITVLPEHYYGKDWSKGNMESVKALNSAPMGAGPYIFESYKDNVATLRSNENYFEGEPLIRTIKFQVIPTDNNGDYTNALEKTVDVIEVPCTPENVAGLEEGGLYCMTYDNNGWGYVGVSASLIPDINIRKGLMHIMNRGPAVESYYGKYADVLERPITTASWGYPTGATEFYGYDKAKALDYFEKAGYTQKDGKLVNDKGEVLRFEAYPNSNTHPVIPLFAQMKLDLEEMGAEFLIEQLDWATYNEKYKNFELMIWAAAYGDGPPDPDCYQYFHSDAIAAKNNPFFLNDAKVDELIMKGRSVLDADERKPIYKELFDAVMETATVMPYYQRKKMFSVNPDIVDTSTLIQDPDPFYGFFENILDLRLK